jgi:hypothetical protein
MFLRRALRRYALTLTAAATSGTAAHASPRRFTQHGDLRRGG